MASTKLILIGLIGTLAAGAAVGFATGQPKTTETHGVVWYDSFGDARTVAEKSGKPILLLSMFGKLDEKMPCTNARTLRATLFKDAEFKKLLSEDVVGAWEMVRAVPKIKIDLGDGKPITRTVRGNAVMYLCNSDGKVVDAFPGVYTAKDFIPMIRESLDKLATADTSAVLDYHTKRGIYVQPARMTFGKTVAESPTLDLIGSRDSRGKSTPIEGAKNPKERLFLQAASGLRDFSLTPMSSGEALLTLTGQPTPLGDPNQTAQEIIALDSQNNIHTVRPVVHLYFATLDSLPTPAQARDAILETILKIPYKDPYFGLKDVVMPGTVD